MITNYVGGKGMKFHNITKDDMLNGEGLRVVLWVAGCSHRCEKCQNPVTWDPNKGEEFDEDAKNEIFQQLEQDYIAGITFSGGDPLFETNIDEITALAKEIKEKFPGKTIWLYTGFTWEEVKKKEIANYLDVLVDGKFKIEFLDPKLEWKGSSNQRVIDVPKTISLKQVVLYA